jgi:hypothetical protein
VAVLAADLAKQEELAEEQQELLDLLQLLVVLVVEVAMAALWAVALEDLVAVAVE